MMIHNMEELEAEIEKKGFLPFFRNSISGFSVEEITSADLWFSDDKDGPWEWKGPLIREGKVLYGKFFQKKSGFISREWYADFMNYRRDGYDFEGRFNDHMASEKERSVLALIEKNPNIISTYLKELTGSMKGLDGVLNSLMMKGYIVNSDFTYRHDKNGRQYGWGIAHFDTPEHMIGEEFVLSAYKREPKESYRRICDHLHVLFPDADEKDIRRMVG